MLLRLPLLFAVASFLVACQTNSTVSASDAIREAVKPRADKSLTEEDCRDPVDIPDRDLGWKETSQLWGQDRASLVDCKARNRANRRTVKVTTR